MLKEFKEFALKGNVLDMAIGIIIGAAFGKVVASLVDDVLTPPLGLLQKGADGFKDVVIHLGNKDGATIKIGAFINASIQFLILAFAVFLLVKGINKVRRLGEKPEAPVAPTTKECPHCLSVIPIKATRCGHCTSELQPAELRV